MSKAKNTRSSPPAPQKGAPASGPRWLFVALIAAGALILTVAAYVLLRSGASTQPASPAQPARPAQPVQAGNTPQPVSGPRLSVAQDVFDYGDVKVNQPVEAVFRVKNVGDKPLQILEQPQVEVVEGC